jgi:hypothetical protein
MGWDGTGWEGNWREDDSECLVDKKFEGLKVFARRTEDNPAVSGRLSNRYSAGLRARWAGVRVPAGAGNFSFHHRVQPGSGAHIASYPMGNRGSSGRGVKLTTHLHLMPRSRMRRGIPPLPNTHPWRDSQLQNKAQGQIYLYIYLPTTYKPPS